MSEPLVDDGLWERLAALVPPAAVRVPPRGRPRFDDRRLFAGIVFVLRTGLPWEELPQEMGCGSGMSCWRRLRDWHRAGVWRRLHESLLAELRRAGRLDWSRAVVDSSHVRAVGGGGETGPSPVDRRKPGSKHHIVIDACGVPLAVILTPANRSDVTQLLVLVDTIPPVRGKPGRPRRRPDRVQGDRAYDSEPHRRELRRRGIEPVIAKRRTAHGSGLGVSRWMVERTIAWLHKFRRLRVRYDWTPEIHEALLELACCLICHRILLDDFC